MNNHFIVRKGQLDDLTELRNLFMNTVTEICKTDYSSNQIEAWIYDTKNNVNQKRWIDVLTKQFVLVAQSENRIVGFVTLDKGNYIDFLFVHKDYQRKGIANRLYKEIENEARRQQKTILTSDVSKTARPFFEKNEFKVVREQIVDKKGVKLINYKMAKTIGIASC